MHGGGDRPDGSVALAWAKSPNRKGATGSGWLSLIDHSIDVAAVAEALANLPTIRARLGSLAGRDLSDVDIARLCFLVGLHDAGKVNHGFQARLAGKKPDAGHIGPLWVLLGSVPLTMEGRRLRRDVLRALMASRWRSWFADTDAECGFWSVILAHHGTLPAHDAPRSDPRLWRGRDGYDPLASLEVVAEILADMFSRRAFAPDHDHLPDRSRFQHAFAGLVTLADWLGSDGTVFGSEREGAPSGRSRVRWARQQAAALMNRRWFDPGRAREAAAQCSMDFGTLFPHVPAPRTPRPAQVALLEASLPRPGQVTVLEAETGSGKTEAALIHFLRLFRASEVDGLYFALPTRAAAVQIHRRIRQTLGGWLGAAAPPVGLAVPGYLRADDHEGERLPQSFDVLWPDEADRDRTWAVENAKRYLSGAVMVGTVDQLLMGGLRVGHAPFRSGPMLRLLLCVDEVHASDAYMTELLRNVLDQHRAAGGHAILMSATLGSLARLRLLGGRVEAHQAADAVRAAAEPYPSMQTSGGELQALPGDRRAACEKRVAVEVLNPEMDDGPLLARLKAAAAAGAAVLFIRNRVDDARRTVQQLEEIGAPLLRCRGRTAPHHGRFAPEDRRLLDDALERALSPRESRDGVVAVTTQTAEQSLDIDADWLVTDIAPGDVLLQRIGRLHRHDRGRAAGFEAPRVTVLAPTPDQLVGGLSERGEVRRGRTILGLGRVYPNIVGILATRAWLVERGQIRIPDDNRQLVETATHCAGLVEFADDRLRGPWPAHLRDVEGKNGAAATAARVVEIDWHEGLTENQPVVDGRASTRLGLRDRRVELPEPCSGPFGQPVRVLNVPGWMVEGESDDAVPASVSARDGEIRFRFGSRAFRYDRLGLTIVTAQGSA